MANPEFRSFGELNQHFEDVEKNEAEAKEEKFEKYVAGQFSKFRGNFKSSLDGVESITLIPAPTDKEGKVNSLNVIPIWNTEKGQRHETLTLLKDGILSGKMPKDLEKLGIAKEDLQKEVLYLAETIDLGFFENTDSEIMSADEADEEILEGEKREMKKERKEPAEPVTDPRRIEFFRKQQDALFAVNGKGGFKGYSVFVFPDGAVYEKPDVGNATYVFKFEDPIEVDENRLKLEADRRMTSEERQEVIESRLTGIIGSGKEKMTRKKLVSMGGKKVVHPRTTETDEDWEKRMEERVLAELRA